MPAYEVLFTLSAIKNLGRLDSVQQQRIRAKLTQYAKSGNPLMFARQLSGVKPPTYRYRIGKYRVIFDVKGTSLRILNVSLRDKAYTDL